MKTITTAAPRTRSIKRLPTAKAADMTPDLDFFGVPDSVHDRAPGPELFPARFNPQQKKVWDRQFKDEVFSAALRSCASNAQRWNMCIKSYLAACRMENASPFAPHYLEDENGRVTATLKAHRTAVHRALESAGLTAIKFTSAKPTIVRRKTGFAVSVACRMSLKGHAWSDPEALSKHLAKHGFTQTKAGLYERAVNLEASVRIDTRRGKSILSYDIACARHPFIANATTKVVTKAQYAKFVESKIWRPLVKGSPSTFCKFGI